MTAAATPAPLSLSPLRQTWGQRLWQDLQPAPGRLAANLRIVLATVIALVLMMVLQMPFASLGLYYIFLIVRESPAVSVRSGVFAIATLVFAVAVELFVVIISDNNPMARVLSVILVSFIAGMLMAASTQPALAAIWGFIYCTVIALWERPAPPDAVVKASLYLIATVTTAFLCAVLVEYLFAFRHPADRLTDQMRVRYKAIEGVFTLLSQGASAAQLGPAIAGINRLAATGQGPMQELYNTVVERDLPKGSLPVGSRVRITMLAQLMDLCAAFASQHPAGVDAELRARCAEIARRCREQESIEPEAVYDRGPSPTLLDRIETILDNMFSMPANAAGDEEMVALPASKVPFLIPGAITNKDAVAYALKITLCVIVCYVFYFAVAWPGISTSVTTVFIVALGNSGAIKQKLANRFIGSAIGGALAIAATVFLFPHMDTIFSLVLLIAGVAFVSAWWAAGRQFGYAGLQIAFSFYLVAFEGFSAPTELAPARDRLVGIMVALLVVWVVFDQLWPVRTVTAMRRALVGILRGEAKLLRFFQSTAPHKVRLHQVDGLRDQIGKTVASLRTMNDSTLYEFGVDRAEHTRKGEAILRVALKAVPFFWNQLAVLHNEQDQDFLTEPGLIAMRSKMADHLDSMAEAVGREVPITPLPVSDIVGEPILENPRYGEYARNSVAAHAELQAGVSSLFIGP